MARRTKEQKRLDDLVSSLCQNSMNGYQINIMDMRHLSAAGESAATAGKSDSEIESAINAARDQYAKAS